MPRNANGLDRQRARRCSRSGRRGNRFEFRRGQLVRHWAPAADGDATRLDGMDPGRAIEAQPTDPGPPEAGPLDAELTDELLLMARWLDRNAGRIRVNHVEGELSSPVRPVPVPGRVAVPAGRRLAP